MGCVLNVDLQRMFASQCIIKLDRYIIVHGTDCWNIMSARDLRGNYTLKFSRHLPINIDAKNKVLYH